MESCEADQVMKSATNLSRRRPKLRQVSARAPPLPGTCRCALARSAAVGRRRMQPQHQCSHLPARQTAYHHVSDTAAVSQCIVRRTLTTTTARSLLARLASAPHQACFVEHGAYLETQTGRRLLLDLHRYAGLNACLLHLACRKRLSLQARRDPRRYAERRAVMCC